MKFFHFLLLLLFPFIATGCLDGEKRHNAPLQTSDFGKWNDRTYSLYSGTIRSVIDSMRRENVRMYADEYVRQYYASKQPFVWITRSGVDRQADSLLAFLEQTPAYGQPARLFRTERIKEDLRRVRELDFSRTDNINTAFGRVEYRLTQALLRYACGQRYGYVRPDRILNRLEQTDTTRNAPFRRLYDMPVESAGETFVREALSALKEKRLMRFLHDIQPDNPVYRRLATAYGQATDKKLKEKLALNIERSRWRTEHPSGKYVWVNLAGMYLIAMNEKSGDTLEMKVCGGSDKHKSPMLTSKIERMDLNPYWIVPYSIIKKEIAPRHAQSTSYFSRNRIRIFDKETGEEADPAAVTASMLTSGRYRLRQDNGEGNSLGRLIFRFPNNFSVFLHDTDNKQAFGRDNRAISHGCIRVEKPLELALFLWENADEKAIDKLRTEIGLPPLNGKEEEKNEDRKPKTGTRRFDTPVPIFIDYYTAYPDLHDGIGYYPDIYGYDEALQKKLDAF